MPAKTTAVASSARFELQFTRPRYTVFVMNTSLVFVESPKTSSTRWRFGPYSFIVFQGAYARYPSSPMECKFVLATYIAVSPSLVGHVAWQKLFVAPKV